jgi:signal recognition particle GTPase
MKGLNMSIRLILIGGFLGAGKTTLMLKATEILLQRGKRVGLVTNDQGHTLVDTALARRQLADSGEQMAASHQPHATSHTPPPQTIWSVLRDPM